MAQKRIRALDTYVSGAVALSSLYFPIDSINFGSEPFKVPLEDILVDNHPENGRLSGLGSANVTVVFDTAYTSIPIGREPEVYRMEQMPSGVWRRQQVGWGFDDANQPSLTGFALTISASESLTGVIVEWDYK
jgi:hypothetical protein